MAARAPIFGRGSSTLDDLLAIPETERVRAEPFLAIETDVGVLFGDDED